MKKIFIISLFSIAIIIVSCKKELEFQPKQIYYENYYQTKLCTQLNGVMEESLLDRTRIDCLTDEYAIEVEFAKKWAESVGQSLYYAEMTGKNPAVGFIVRDTKQDKRHMKRLKVLADKYEIKIFKIKRGEYHWKSVNNWPFVGIALQSDDIEERFHGGNETHTMDVRVYGQAKSDGIDNHDKIHALTRDVEYWLKHDFSHSENTFVGKITMREGGDITEDRGFFSIAVQIRYTQSL